MQLLILGQGKTGSHVADVARERRHHFQTLCGADNANASTLTPDFLAPFNAVIDFTNPSAVVANVEACIRARKAIVVGTTGWYDHLPRLREQAQTTGSALLYSSNFSIGVNLFFEIVQTAAAAMNFDYSGQIFERHHAQKKDAPSGTAMVMQKIIREATNKELEIVSFREGDAVGMHELVFNSQADRVYLCHDSKSRRGFAEGAVRAAEWLVGKTGVFDFRNVWREL
ncbi:MAG TPA: dihydrodipicolinate reductase C-terminal domain-containing protein [Terriglobales bacterium]|nr:dihydrodipicolinate reductase C-terminal domain-containing protein [Terriglobales bacterium]